MIMVTPCVPVSGPMPDKHLPDKQDGTRAAKKPSLPSAGACGFTFRDAMRQEGERIGYDFFATEEQDSMDER